MATTWEYQNRESGASDGWEYNTSELTYNDDATDQGQVVYYNSAGSATVWALQAQS
jgi:hypothetical protein